MLLSQASFEKHTWKVHVVRFTSHRVGFFLMYVVLQLSTAPCVTSISVDRFDQSMLIAFQRVRILRYPIPLRRAYTRIAVVSLAVVILHISGIYGQSLCLSI